MVELTPDPAVAGLEGLDRRVLAAGVVADPVLALGAVRIDIAGRATTGQLPLGARAQSLARPGAGCRRLVTRDVALGYRTRRAARHDDLVAGVEVGRPGALTGVAELDQKGLPAVDTEAAAADRRLARWAPRDAVGLYQAEVGIATRLRIAAAAVLARCVVEAGVNSGDHIRRACVGDSLGLPLVSVDADVENGQIRDRCIDRSAIGDRRRRGTAQRERQGQQHGERTEGDAATRSRHLAARLSCALRGARSILQVSSCFHAAPPLCGGALMRQAACVRDSPATASPRWPSAPAMAMLSF